MGVCGVWEMEGILAGGTELCGWCVGCGCVCESLSNRFSASLYSLTIPAISLDPRPHFPLHLGKWAWYRLLAHALISPRYLGALDNIVYAQ